MAHLVIIWLAHKQITFNSLINNNSSYKEKISIMIKQLFNNKMI